MRPLLHRASLAYNQYVGNPQVADVAGLYQTANYLWRVPYGVGRNPNGYGYATVSTAGVGYNFSPNHPIDWVLNCFIGYRGSTNIHVNTSGVGSNVTNVSHLAINRFFGNPILTTGALVRNADFTANLFTTPNQYARNTIRYPSGTRTIFPTGQTGMTLTNVQGQPACSANVPQYSRFRFLPAFSAVRNVDPKTGNVFQDNVAVTCQFNNNGTLAANSDWPALSYYYSAGVDFQPIFFLCTPRLFATVLPPARDVYP